MAVRFDHKVWENRGQQKVLRGYQIGIREYNQGKDASYYVEAWGNPYDVLRGKKPAPSVGRTIQGKGQAAKARAIEYAMELSRSGLYTRTQD